jgi:hypothetical protein
MSLQLILYAIIYLKNIPQASIFICDCVYRIYTDLRLGKHF